MTREQAVLAKNEPAKETISEIDRILIAKARRKRLRKEQLRKEHAKP